MPCKRYLYISGAKRSLRSFHVRTAAAADGVARDGTTLSWRAQAEGSERFVCLSDESPKLEIMRPPAHDAREDRAHEATAIMARSAFAPATGNL